MVVLTVVGTRTQAIKSVSGPAAESGRAIQPLTVLHYGAQSRVYARDASEGADGGCRRMPDALEHGDEHPEREQEDPFAHQQGLVGHVQPLLMAGLKLRRSSITPHLPRGGRDDHPVGPENVGGRTALDPADTGIDGQTPIDLDELDLVVIDPLPSWVWYQDMADFAVGITNERAERRLARAIEGRGVFRRFKNELHEEFPDLLPASYAFRDARARRRAVEWLTDNSLIDDDSVDRFLEAHPDPALP